MKRINLWQESTKFYIPRFNSNKYHLIRQRLLQIQPIVCEVLDLMKGEFKKQKQNRSRITRNA